MPQDVVLGEPERTRMLWAITDSLWNEPGSHHQRITCTQSLAFSPIWTPL